MADPVHPAAPSSSADPTSSPEKLHLPPGTYVIQIPKDQIFRHPPPENAHKFQNYSARKHRRSRCCCCLWWFLGLLLLLILLLAIAAGVFYLVFRPKALGYSVEGLSVSGFNVSSASPISPSFNVTVRANNPNKKISVYYGKDSLVRIYHSDVELSDGVLPAFYQPPKNVTVFRTVLKDSGIVLTRAARESLVAQQRQGSIPLKVKLKAPVRVRVGALKTWTITVKVSCDVSVDKLTASSKIVSKDCDFTVRLW